MKLKKLAGLIFLLCMSPAWAIEPFTVKDIRVEGIQRTEAGTVFNYLPIKVGGTMDDQQAAAAIQNVALLAWLRYPWSMLGRAVLQMGNMIVDQLRRGRWRGLPAGVLGIPGVLWRFRHLRRPCPAKVVRAYLARRRLPTVISAALQEVRA